MKKFLLIMLLMLSIVLLISVPRNKVLVEIGTGGWCQYCPGAAMGADDLVANGHPVAIIENHNGDPYATTDSNGRNTYYGITGYPTAWFDGLNPSVGGSHTVSMYSNYLPKVNARMAVESHFTISATGENTGSNYTVAVVLDKVQADTNSNLKFHAVITESDIQYAWQGQTEMNFVNRLMITGLSGQAIDFTSGNTLNIPLSFTSNPAWVTGHCELVLFIQNSTSKEVLQAAKFSFPELFGAYSPSVTELDFPDTFLTGEANLPITIYNYWNITATGTITTDNPAFVITPAERLDFVILPYDDITFNVSFAPTTAGDITGNLLITSNMPDNEAITIPLTGNAYFDTAPYVSNVAVSGIPVITMMQNASYTFNDADSDAEGTSVYQWYRLTPPATEGVAISGANSVNYRLVQADVGSQIAFSVTPYDSHNMPGTTVLSPYSPTVEALPAPQNLAAQVINNQDVTLTWEAPNHFSRDFLGYRVFRGGLAISTINNTNTTTFTDTWLNPGEYQYWVTSIFSNPISQSEPSNTVTVNITANSDEVTPAAEMMQVYPNPFRANATISVSSKANAPVNAAVYNVRGQQVKQLNAVTDAQGNATLSLQRTEDMLPGVYFVKVMTPTASHSQKVIVLR